MNESVPDYGGRTPERIAVFRALQLGDLLCAVPALRALRRAFSTSEITLVGLPWAHEFARRFAHLVDRFIAFPGYPGLPERAVDVGGIPRFLEMAQAQRFDVALQLHGSGGITNPIVVAMGARMTAGFYRAGEYCPDPHRFMTWPERGPEIVRCLKLIEFLGVPPAVTALEFPLDDADLDAWQATASAHGLVRGGYACLHPGARLATRRWPAARFARVADGLAAMGLRIVLTGTGDERPLTHAVAAAASCPVVDLAGETSMGAVAALISQARVLVCNDTGVSHIAAALGVPSLVVCCGADPERWAPLDSECHRVVFQPVDCRPCDYVECPIGHPCATGISADEVVAEIESLLRRVAQRGHRRRAQAGARRGHH